MNVEGGCLCGLVRYELLEEPLFVQACHCTHCQRTTGSAFIVSIVLEASNLKVQEGVPTVFKLTGGSGKVYDVFSCSECGTALWSAAQGECGGIIYIRAGTLDETRYIRPAAHIYMKSKQEWVSLPGGTPAFQELYDREDVWPSSSLKRLEALGQDS